jgi:hypothetical protein
MHYLPDSNSSTDIMDYRRLARLYGWNEDSLDSSDISELYLDDDSEGFDVAMAEYEPIQRHWVREPVQRAAVLRPQTDTTGFIHAGRWPYPSDEFSCHEMASVSSSATDCASLSSSDPSIRGIDGLPADSIRFWNSEAFHEQLRQHTVASAETWTPIMQNHPSTRVLLNNPDEDIMVRYDWAQRSNELWHLNRQTATHRRMCNYDEVPCAAASHNVSP